MRPKKNKSFVDGTNRSPISLSIKLLSLLFILLIFDVGKTRAMHNDNLIVTDGIFYKADSLQKFTGVTTGKEQFTIQNGILEGPYSRFYDNGRLREEGSFSKGKMQGIIYYYYPNGQLKRIANYQFGIKDGEMVEYWSNGMMFAQFLFKNDLENGKQIIYSRTGNINYALSGIYVDGTKVASFTN
jgi:antitoxin component YwqK of YwqJK toxin-antitoxin module